MAALLPEGVVTITDTAPALCAGVTQVISVALTTFTDVAAKPSKLTDDAPVKLAPLTLTLVPPVVRPVAGLTLVRMGAGSVEVNSELAGLAPAGVVT